MKVHKQTPGIGNYLKKKFPKDIEMTALNAGEETRQIIDLGWENSWGPVPDIVRACMRAGHPARERCLDDRGVTHEVSCPICKYRYRVDSSD